MPSDASVRAILDTLYFSGAQAAGSFWMAGIGGILMLHHVREDTSAAFQPNAHLSVTPDFLNRVLTELAERFEFVSMDEALKRIRNHDPKGWNDPFLTVTLDDAYRDNLVNAVPLFRKHGVPYTIYVASGLVDGTATLWWEDLEAVVGSRDRFFLQSPKGKIPFETGSVSQKNTVYAEISQFLTSDVDEARQRELVQQLADQVGWDAEAHRAQQIMSWAELAELARDPLCTIGAHTVRHYAVARLSVEEAEFEMAESARIIEMELGEAPRHFAFPYGYAAAAGQRDFLLAAAIGFDSAVTTRHGVIYREHGDHLTALPRISLNGRFQAMRYVKTMLSGIPTRIQNRGHKLNVA